MNFCIHLTPLEKKLLSKSFAEENGKRLYIYNALGDGDVGLPLFPFLFDFGNRLPRRATVDRRVGILP